METELWGGPLDGRAVSSRLPEIRYPVAVPVTELFVPAEEDTPPALNELEYHSYVWNKSIEKYEYKGTYTM